jgi:hypothetical protein
MGCSGGLQVALQGLMYVSATGCAWAAAFPSAAELSCTWWLSAPVRQQRRTDLLPAWQPTNQLITPLLQVTFRADLTSRTPANPPTRFTLPANYDSDVDLQGPTAPLLAAQAHYEGSAHVSRPGFESDEWIPARLLEFGPDCFGLLWFTIDSFSLYSRLELPPVVPQTC